MDRRYMDMDRRILIVTFAAFLSLPCIEMLGTETDSETDSEMDGATRGDTFQFDDWAKTLDLSIKTKEVLRSEELTTERTLSLLNLGDILSLNLPLGQRKLIEAGVAEIKRKAGGGSSSNNAEMLGTETDSEMEDQGAKSRSDPSTSPLCWNVQKDIQLDVSGKKLTGVGMEHCEFCCRNDTKTECVAMNYDSHSRVCYMLTEDHRDGRTQIYKENLGLFYAYLDPCDTGFMNWLNENKWTIAGTVLSGGATLFAAPYLIAGVLAQIGFSAVGVGGGTIAAKLMALYGGKVVAGSLFAALQSIGAAGVGSTGIFVSSLFGAGAGGLASAAVAPKECTIETCPCA